LIGQLLTESITLGVLGGALGLAVAAATLMAVRAFDPGNIPRLDQIGLDARVLGFTLAVSVLTGIAFGLAPALRAQSLDIHTALKSGGRAGQPEGGLSPTRGLRGMLVVAEVALSLMLLVGAGLLIRSFASLLNVSPGFNPNNVVSMQVMLSGADIRDRTVRAQFFERMDDAVRRVPGVTAAGATVVLPLTPSVSWGGMTVEGYTPPPGESDLQLDQRIVTPDYFSTMGIPLKEGSFFTPADTAESQPVFIVDEKLARQFWPNESAIGKRIKPGRADSKAPWRTIVGVVGSVKQYGLEVDGRRVVYYANKQAPPGGTFAVARTEGDPAAATASVIGAIRSVDPRVAVFDVATMDQRVFRSLARQRFAMIMLAAFAGFALLLAAIGIYSVVSYLVSQGTRDIGIRMALGAERQVILSMIVRHGLVLTAGGVVAGVVGALALTRVMRSLLFEVSPSDLTTFSTVPVLLAAVALAASYIPARRATRIDPMVALRDE
jgi:predicted permease